MGGSSLSQRKGIVLPSIKRDILPELHWHDPQAEGHMASFIGRRRFLATIAGSAVAWPLNARAQQPRRVWRVGFLTAVSFEEFSHLYAGFQLGMGELGYLEGKDYISEWRSVEGKYERVPEISAELVRLRVDVIVTGTAAALPALKRTITTIPIVMATSTDPVGSGLVESLARPGGNMTGLASSYDDSSPKQLELLAMIVPSGSRIGLLGNPNNPIYLAVLKSAQDAGQKAGLSLVVLEARDPQEIDNAFAAFAKERVPAVMVAGDAVFFGQRWRIAELALANRLPTMFPQREYTEAGGLMSYGENLADFFRRAASYVDKIFKGAKPGELPIEQPTRFNLTINRKTANALGITIPPQLYIFAGEVIE
jgi:putative tryptophan/tyrosine transport system substrate-binding protein